MDPISGPDFAVAICCIVASIGGVIANGSLIFLIGSSKDLRRKEYICFVLNRALIDFVYSILLGTLQPLAILKYDPNSDMCAAAGYLELMLGSASIYAEPLLAVNRYVSILQSEWYKQLYTKKTVPLMCAFSWVLGMLTALPHVFLKSLGRVDGSFCIVKFSWDNLVVLLLVNYSCVLVGIGAIVLFNCKIFFYLNKYQHQPMSNSQRTQLQSDREILQFIFVAAFLPLVLQFPLVGITFVKMVMPVSGWVMFGGMCLFMGSFVVDPVITLIMVRPIRKQLVDRYKKMVGRNVSTVQVEPMARFTN